MTQIQEAFVTNISGHSESIELLNKMLNGYKWKRTEMNDNKKTN